MFEATLRNRSQPKLGALAVTFPIPEERYNTWKQTQKNWVLVNGQLVGGSFHGQTDASDGTSDAFTLNNGWNVVEVYTNFAPYHLFNDLSLSSSGMHAKRFAAAGGATYYFKSVIRNLRMLGS